MKISIFEQLLSWRAHQGNYYYRTKGWKGRRFFMENSWLKAKSGSIKSNHDWQVFIGNNKVFNTTVIMGTTQWNPFLNLMKMTEIKLFYIKNKHHFYRYTGVASQLTFHSYFNKTSYDIQMIFTVVCIS